MLANEKMLLHLMLLKGTGLVDGPPSSPSPTLQNQIAGASVVIGAETISLLYADAGQLVGLVPTDAAPNSSPQLIVLRDNAVAIATPVIISPLIRPFSPRTGRDKGKA